MKKFTFLILFGLLAFWGQAQVNICEAFDSSLAPPTGWTATGYFGAVTQVCDGFSQRDNLDATSTTGNLTSYNAVGVSNGTDVTVSFDYKVVDWSAAVDATPPGWGEILVNYSTNDGGSWTTAFVVNDDNHTPSSTCATLDFTIPAASVPAGSDFKIQFVGNWLQGNFYIYLDNVCATQEVSGVPTCSSLITPSPGSTGVSINTDLEWTAATNVPNNYHLTVGTTSGGSELLDIDTGLSTVYNLLPELEYSTTYYVNITPSNANGPAEGCQEFTFTTGADPNAPVDCSSGAPINIQYCYGNNDTTTWNFSSSDGSPLNVFFNAGGIESCCDDILIYNGTDASGELLFSGNNGGNLTGLTYTALSGFLYIEIDSDSSVSCASNSTCCTSPWDFDISCVDETAVPNCNAAMTSPENGETDVNENSDIVWSPASVLVTGYTVNVGTTPGGSEIGTFDTAATTIDPGTLPYETTVYVTIIPYNDNGDADCSGGAGEFSFTTKADPNQIVDCGAGEIINTTYCYNSSENESVNAFYFASSDGSPLFISFNSGEVENNWDELYIIDSDGTNLNADTPYGNGGNLAGLSWTSTGSTLTVYVESDTSVSCVSSTSIDPWDFDVTCVDTSALPNCNASLTSPVNGDIDINENDDIFWSPATVFVTGYYVSLGTTSGGTDIADNVDVGDVLTYDPGTLPYDTTIYVTITPYNENGSATDCVEESFITRADPNQIVDCSSGEGVNTVYCYNSSENESVMSFNFTSSDGSPLFIIFNSGNVENNWDELYIIDSDGTNLNAATPYGNSGNLTGLSYTSTGDSLTIYVESDGSVSCQSSANINPWDFDVFCVDTSALPNCDAAMTAPFDGETDVDEDEDIAWSQATVFVTGYYLSIGTAPGGTDVLDSFDVGDVLSYDPGTLEYATTYYVSIVPYNENGSADSGCSEYSFTTRNDPNQIVDCEAAEVINTTYCYENGSNFFLEIFSFQSSTGFPLNIEFNAGYIESCCDFIRIEDGNGTVLYEGNNGGNLAGVAVQSITDSLVLYIDADTSVSCSSTGNTPWDFDVWCQTCLPQTVDFAVVNGDCSTDPDNPTFEVTVDISDMGDAETITLTDNLGSEPQVASETGVLTFGPYPANSSVIITAANTNDGNCVVESGILTFLCPPPPNECSIVYAGEDQTVSCDDPEATLSGFFHQYGQDTSSYEINSISTCPTPPVDGATPTSVDTDDTWSDVIDLGFEFCFFGGVYDQVIIGSNGVLSFELEYADTGNNWDLNTGSVSTLPNATNPTITEANIFGVGHDIDPSVCGSIDYVVLGSSPYRQFVVNFNSVCHFGTACNSLQSTSQIVLHESSNNIDVHILSKPTCTSWNDGLAVVGIQNIDDTIGIAPPDRNTGVWTVDEPESWRFSPAGTPNYTLEWLDGNGEVVGNEDTVTVTPSETTTYTLAVTYDLCTGGQGTVEDHVVVNVEGGNIDVEITEEPLSEYCPGVILTAVSEDAVSYLWTTDEDTGSITVTNNGIYGVTVTNETGCSSYLEYEVTSIDSNGSSLSDYTIIANNRVFLHGNNMVFSGGVGVTGNNGQIKLHQNSHITDFGEAASFALQQGSTIGEQIDGAADVTLPPFIYNTQSNSDSPSVTIPAGQSMTLDGTVYDLIDMKQGATITFTQSNVSINRLKTLEGAVIDFEGCTNLYLNDLFILSKNSVLNPLGNRVSLYVNNDVHVEQNCKVEAMIYVNGNNNQILAKGSNINTPDSEATFMKGLFIANRVHGDQNVYWEIGDICEPCPTDDFAMDRQPNFDVVSYPNPSSNKFNLKLRSDDFYTDANVNVYDLSGKLIHTTSFKPGQELSFGSEFEGGIYLVKVSQGNNTKVVRLIKN